MDTTKQKYVSILNHLDIDHKKAETIVNNSEDYYLSYPIKKSDKRKMRWIDAPLDKLKEYQYAILYKFLYNFAVHDNAVGFKIGTNVKDGANRHLGNKVILTMDISNFFNSVKIQHVYRLFSGLVHRYKIKNSFKHKDLSEKELSQDMADVHLLCNLVCFKGQLPQGAPTSPAIANLVARSLDSDLTDLAKKKGLTYTRYADDITLSHPDKNHKIGEYIKYVGTSLERLSLKVNHKKTRVLRPHRRMTVTGVVINDKLGVPKYKWRNLRAKLHNLKKSNRSIDEHEYQEIRGYCEWIRNLHPQRGKQLIEKLGTIPLQNS